MLEKHRRRATLRSLGVCLISVLPVPRVGADEIKASLLAPPLYMASPVDAITLSYSLHRGLLSGEGQLEWRPQGAGYTLSLMGSVAGFRWLEQRSVGTLNHHGLAPQQFSDQRGRNSQTATILNTEKRIAYSHAADAPWVPGTQDRLSWMIQLPAIISRLPVANNPEQRIILYITGARSDADIWRFRFVSMETVSTPLGPIMSHKWVREPRRELDSSVEVWLDPTRHYLPVRAQIGATDGAAIELLLRGDIPRFP
jgi:hypothetical protein